MVTENLSLFLATRKYYGHVCAVQRAAKQKGEELGRQPYIICVLEDEINFLAIKENHDKMRLNLFKTLLESTPIIFLVFVRT